jgi:hypothetical protein
MTHSLAWLSNYSTFTYSSAIIDAKFAEKEKSCTTSATYAAVIS